MALFDMDHSGRSESDLRKVLPEEVAQRCARALRWLGWEVYLQNEAGEILEEFSTSGPRGELRKCRWSPLE